MHFFKIILILFPLISTVSSTCAFTQTCKDPSIGDCEIPNKQISEPQNYTYSDIFQCPEFANAPRCCNSDQNILLKNSFSLIGYTFGSGANGCDLCGANLMRFWCWFTCAPNQSDFAEAFDHIIVPDPFTPGLNVTVCNVTLKIDPDTACEMYQSCKKTPYVSEVSAMNSAEGLLNFLGSNAVATGKEKITMIYTNNASLTPLNLSLHNCNQSYYIKDDFGYPVAKNCTCNNCDTSCSPINDNDNNPYNIIHSMDVMDGFDSTVIIAFYCALVGETIACLIARRFFKQERKRKNSRGLFVENQ